MIKKYQSEVLRLTQYILEQYWQKNTEPLLTHIDENILWIGSMDEEYIHGKETMTLRIDENNLEKPLVYMDSQEFEIVQNEGNTCIVVGRYRAYTKPESGMLLSEKQRVTFVWEKIPSDGAEKLRIKHIHLSNVLHIQSEDERFPTRAGRENYEYVKRTLAERGMNAVVTVKDDRHTNHVINYSDIMYIIADHNYINIHRNGYGVIRSRANLSAFIVGFPDEFIKPCRSYCVNKSYIKTLNGRKLTMVDGREFIIPTKYLRQIHILIKTK